LQKSPGKTLQTKADNYLKRRGGTSLD
ncbi:MAG: hypothetical protein ACJA02_001180, partial [Myxococcota bacterium]